MDVVVLPTNKAMVREDVNDVVYVNEEDKFNALVAEIKDIHENCTNISWYSLDRKF